MASYAVSGRVLIIRQKEILSIQLEFSLEALEDINAFTVCLSQNVAGYIGFWQTLAGCIASIFIAR